MSRAIIWEVATLALALLALGFCVSLLSGCGLTTKDASDLEKASATILCVLEHEELDDAALNAICGALTNLTPEQKAAITRHSLVKKSCKPEKVP